MSWFNKPKKCNCQLLNSIHIGYDGNIYICHGCPYVNNNSKFILGNTKNNSLESCLIKNMNFNYMNKTCETCEAVYCAICHIFNVENESNLNNVINNWIVNRSNDINKCKYY
jgi:radical SAM protein with 4Fe4S-binding SPASM domain